MASPRTPDAAALDVCVVAHTHWDREWYQTAPRFRQRLAALVEAVLAAGPSAERPFLLDGQAVVLEDVLGLRPDLRAPLAEALVSGAIEAGPWYVLADELLPSGEALIRNLLAGRRVLRGFGVDAPAVCYSPDAFGHPAALPAIAAGFGCEVGVIWRGFGGVAWPAGDTVRWQAPDGSTMLAWHLPPDGYEYGSALPTNAEAARDRWDRLRTIIAPRARTGVVLCTNGADHHALQPDLDEALRALDAAARTTGDRVTRTSLRVWAQRFAAAAQSIETPVVQGELRDSTGYTWSLQGTFGTRAQQKRLVARADRDLRHDVEPWIALAARRTRGTAPRGHGVMHASMLPQLLARTWTTFLRVLPHDTLCGCSIDAVADALEHRLAVVRDEAAGLREAALDALLSRDAIAARTVARARWVPRVVVRNRVARPRHGLVHVLLERTIRDVPVGPSSGGPLAAADATPTPWPVSGVRQVLGVRLLDRRRESPQHYPDNDLVEETRALVWLPPSRAVPGTGLRVLETTPASRGDATMASEDASVLDAVPPLVRTHRRRGLVSIDNGRLRLEVRASGVSLFDHITGHRVERLLHCTWQADHGDSYTPAPRGSERRLRPVHARLVATGPLRSAVRLTYELRVPTGTAPDERAESVTRRRTSRARSHTRLRLQCTLTLDADAPCVGLTVRGVDRARDHRLRLRVSTGMTGARHVADAACWPVERAVSDATRAADRVSAAPDATRPDVAAPVELPVGVHPLHRWVALHNEHGRATLVSDGLAEYAVDPHGNIAITLVRATGELSRRDMPERLGHAGWPARIPAAQGPGRVAASFALAFGAPCRDVATIAGEAAQLADDVLLPLLGHTWRDAPRESDPQHAEIRGPWLEAPATVQPLAIMPDDAGDGLILRCVNYATSAVDATWHLSEAVHAVRLVRLDETPCPDDARATLRIARMATGTALTVTMAPLALATLHVR